MLKTKTRRLTITESEALDIFIKKSKPFKEMKLLANDQYGSLIKRIGQVDTFAEVYSMLPDTSPQPSPKQLRNNLKAKKRDVTGSFLTQVGLFKQSIETYCDEYHFTINKTNSPQIK